MDTHRPQHLRGGGGLLIFEKRPGSISILQQKPFQWHKN